MRILVTGSAGFVGKNLVDGLSADGHTVTGADWPHDLRFVSRVSDCDVLINAAAVGGVALAARAGDMVMTNNVGLTAALRTALECRPLVVQISSASVYGDAPVPTTTSAPLAPKELYAASKLCQELCWVGYPKLRTLRCWSLYGPHMKLDDPGSTVIAQIARCVRDGETMKLNEDGLQTRDFVHVNDLVDAILELIQPDAEDYPASRWSEKPRVINVCSGVGTSLVDACAAFGCKYEITGNKRPGDMRHCVGDATELERLLGRETIKLTTDTAKAVWA